MKTKEEYKNYIIIKLDNNCCQARAKDTNFVIYESNNESNIEEVKEYLDKLVL